MKFTKYLLILISIFSSCQSKKNVKDPYQMIPPYKLLNLYSQKIKPLTDLVLAGYGFNWCLPEGYQTQGIGNFAVSYKLIKSKEDEISLDSARNLIVFLVENLLEEINTNLEVRQDLDVYPFSSDLVRIDIHFKDEEQVQLGQGVAIAYFSDGTIKYKGYNIEGYSKPGHAYGKHYMIHEESYADALDIVKKQGNLKYL